MKLCYLIITLVLLINSAIAADDPDRRKPTAEPALYHAELLDAWQLLDCGIRYKSVWIEGRKHEGISQTYSDLIRDLALSPKIEDAANCSAEGSHAEYLKNAIEAFDSLIVTANTMTSEQATIEGWGEDEADSEGSGEDEADSERWGENETQSAIWGLQESFNALAEASLLKGNDLLINGLRARFQPARDNNGNEITKPKSQIELLKDSADLFEESLLIVTPQMLAYNDSLRAVGGVVSPDFPFLVRDSQGNVTPNEFQQYTELLNRYGMAASSEAKYLYYKDNVKDVDNPPYRNFPGPEDLDFNNDRTQNEAGRLDAAMRAKKAGNRIYLQSLLVAGLQSENEFEDNNGYQLKRQLNDIDRLYQDIQSGFNPQLLAGDFVPYQPVENFLNLARQRVNNAVATETAARNSKRTFEQDKASFDAELRNQSIQFIDRIEELTGESTAQHDLKSKEGREAYRIAGFYAAMQDKKGLIGVQQLAYEEAVQQVALLKTQMNNHHQRLRNEQQRNGEAVNLIMSTGEKVSALQYANTMASCCNVSTGTSTGGSTGVSMGSSSSSSSSIGAITSTTGGPTFSNGFSSGTSRGISLGKSWGSSEGLSKNPNIETLAQGQSAMALLQATQQAKMDSINGGITEKNILLDMATTYISIEQAEIALKRQEAVIQTQFDQLDRLLANYSVAHEDLNNVYYNHWENPAYRLEASRTEQEAEDSFATAIELSYYAAKALEYQWSEKYNNPVLRLDGGLPEPLSVSFDPFVRAESLFGAQFAGAFNPSLVNYLDALAAWDVKMRQLRSPGRQTARVRFSMRDDILGFGAFAEDVAEAKFRAFIEDNRLFGENLTNRDLQFDFSLDIADENFFPNHPNIKIESLSVNLVSTASHSIRTSDSVGPALVDLVMLDRAFVRTFFAEYPERDDILTYQLQAGRTIDKSPFIATVDSTVDGFSSPQADPNVQLANHSPAVSSWVLRMRNNRYNNRHLKLEYLSDIELEVQYSFGKPRDIKFF